MMTRYLIVARTVFGPAGTRIAVVKTDHKVEQARLMATIPGPLLAWFYGQPASDLRATAARLMFVRNWTENGLYDNFNVPGLIGNHRFGCAKAVFRSWSIRRLTPIFEFSARALL